MGYRFVGWYENYVLVSEEESYTFVVTEDRIFTAKFEKIRYSVAVDGEGNLLNTYFVNGNIWTEDSDGIKPSEGSMENFILFDNPLAQKRIEATINSITINRDGNTRNGIVFALTDIDGDGTFNMSTTDVSYYWVCIDGNANVQLWEMGAEENWNWYGNVALSSIGVDPLAPVTIAAEWDAGGRIRVFTNGILTHDVVDPTPLEGNLYGILTRSWANTANSSGVLSDRCTSFITGGALITPEINVSVTVDPADAGKVTGTGNYFVGTEITLTATSDAGYKFLGWYEIGELVSVDATITFTAEANRTLTAQFAIVYGDADGDGEIDAKDIILLRQYISKLDYDTNASSVSVVAGADVNGDGVVNAKDVVLLRQYIVNYNYETGSSSVVLGPKQ